VPGVKTNEREGTRAVLRHSRLSAYKAREVLDLIRGRDVDEARAVLRFCERDAAIVVGKVLASAVANAEHNDGLDPEDLFVSSCYADEGTTMKRWRPRARGRATRIRKRTCHITVIVGRLPDDRLERRRSQAAAEATARRARRVAGARKKAVAATEGAKAEAGADEAAEPVTDLTEAEEAETATVDDVAQEEAAETEGAEDDDVAQEEAAEEEDAAAADDGETTAGDKEGKSE
jgi:large subunit ribosomal protein L22